MRKKILTNCLMTCLLLVTGLAAEPGNIWTVDTTEEWKKTSAKSDQISFKDSMAEPSAETASYSSIVHRFK